MDRDSQLIWEQYSEREYSHIVQFLPFDGFVDELENNYGGTGIDDSWFQTGWEAEAGHSDDESLYAEDSIFGFIDNEGDKITLVYEGDTGTLVNGFRGPEWSQPATEMGSADAEKIHNMVMSNPRNQEKLEREVTEFNESRDEGSWQEPDFYER